MPPFAVEVHPLAADEAEAAERWYRERNETAAARSRRELDRAVKLIAERPEAAPSYVGNTRRSLLRRFPFFIVYRVYSRHVQVVDNHLWARALLSAGTSTGVDVAPQRDGIALEPCRFARRLASSVRRPFRRSCRVPKAFRRDTPSEVDGRRT